MTGKVFITGTDTGVGKTLVSALLIAKLKKLGRNPGYFKPVQTGTDDDTATVRRWTDLSRASVEPPVYSFALPAAPSIAAAQESRHIDVSRIVERFTGTPHSPLIVEGAGGLLVPLREKQTIADLIQRLEIPAIVVASTRLGTLNHSLLTLEAARARGIPVLGLILVGNPSLGLRQALEDCGDASVFAEIPFIPGIDALTPDAFGRLADRLLPAIPSFLDSFLPASAPCLL